jgi:hypothetical protein
MVDDVPDHLRRYPTRAGRQALAARLGRSIDPFSQDWEWEVAEEKHFPSYLALYKDATLTDDERFSLMEIMLQCVNEIFPAGSLPEDIEQRPEWQAVAALLRARPDLHASTVAYWSVFGGEWPDGQFVISTPMRRIWAEMQQTLAAQSAQLTGLAT